MSLQLIFMCVVAFFAFLAVLYRGVQMITDSLDNIAAAVRGQVVKPVSLVPPSWGKRH